MNPLRVLLVTHDTTLPPEDAAERSDEEMIVWKTEYDVMTALRESGHEVELVGLSNDLGVLREALDDFRPHIAFNLVEEFHDVAIYDQNVISYLELMRQPFTGSNPRGLMLSHDKVLTKKILSYHRLPTAKFEFFGRTRRPRAPKNLSFPVMVKSATEHASRGLSTSSLVYDETSCIERIEYIYEEVGTDALVEEYIEGRELYAGILGNQRLMTFPLWEIDLSKLPSGTPQIATEQVKWDLAYQDKYDIDTGRARGIDESLQKKIAETCKRAFRRLYLSGYARIDLRLTPEGRFYILEANANPNISYGEDFPDSAEAAGIKYHELLNRILSLGLNYPAPWKEAERQAGS